MNAKMGRPPKPIVEFPEPTGGAWRDPPIFAQALALHMTRHGDTAQHLGRALAAERQVVDAKTIRGWVAGAKPGPGREGLFRAIERRYRLPANYFFEKLLAQHGPALPRHAFFTARQRRRARWHLPADFELRPAGEQREIADWITETMIVGGTDYRRFLGESVSRPYGLRFCDLPVFPGRAAHPSHTRRSAAARGAPPRLAAEVSDFLHYKSRVTTGHGGGQSRAWNDASMTLGLRRFSLLFGALAAPADGEHQGLGVPRDALTMALLVLPSVWRWYLAWLHQRREFFTDTELGLLYFARTLSRRGSGWLRERPELAQVLVPVPGILNPSDLQRIRADWHAACDVAHDFIGQLLKDVRPQVRRHRDALEAVRPVIAADRPVAEYRKITTEVLARMPCATRDPLGAAETMRGYLMMRFALHLGLRPRNLRELLVSPPGRDPTPEVALDGRRCGELRWRPDRQSWEVFVPTSAFRNAASSFFKNQAFRMALPDVDALYAHLDLYLARDRPRLLRGAADPATFFVKTVRRSSQDPRFDDSSFHDAFRTMTERYGVHNPYTGHGAIPGLLPHGPDSVRAVLAVHILKQTGSAGLAGFAIQDVAKTIVECYRRALPANQAQSVDVILDREWL